MTKDGKAFMLTSSSAEGLRKLIEQVKFTKSHKLYLPNGAEHFKIDDVWCRKWTDSKGRTRYDCSVEQL